ncbi:sigma-70 family RNA polymerase sigma factor [Thauera mechernichensis]|uniref:Sigma-70 family RNA polymerase sigma factor n=2 Tax=Thauera TaxID=33057 RepID=A0ABW3WCW7_9RHOO|nr:sigma-70 family RNA polymerase sigma factor [Thauera mechernichensis]MDG3065002.1 sigma-70 family RNA polymerase sigma factor [Thauera mechernichensis]
MLSLPRQKSIELLYREHRAWLKDWLRVRLGCPQYAADLAQDTFVRLIQARQGATEAVKLKAPRAYLRVIAHGLMVDHWRRADLERAYAEALASRPEGFEPSPEHRLMVLEVLLRLDALLGRLKPRMREVFILVHIDNCTLAEVAERLSLSRATVERDLAAAMRHCYQQVFENVPLGEPVHG